jgi:hypothetical protein
MGRGRIGLVAAIAALAAAALVTAGCGGGALALDPVAAAATKTQDAGAAKARFSMNMQIKGHSIALRGDGIVDGTSADLTFDFGSLFSKLGAHSGAMGGATKSQLAHAQMEEILLKQGSDFIMYIRFPSFMAAQIPGGKQWMELNFSKLGTLHGINFNQLMSGSSMNPSDMLGMLRTEGATITKVGPETIDGVATTHYSAKIDLAKVLQSKGLTSPMLSQFAKNMGTLPEDVWIGSKDGLVRRLGLAFSTAGVSMRMRIDFSDYGMSATITAPPSSDVFDMTSILASQTH